MKCDLGYLCEVCEQAVETLPESELYLRYVIGRVDPETLHTTCERHLRCSPAFSQFIVDDDFEPVFAVGDFDKRKLDPQFVAEQEELVTRGWRRLRELSQMRELSLLEYPLPEVVEKWRR